MALEDLKISLIEKNAESSIDFLSNILAYSDGRHILEYLLEISLMQKGESMLFIWSSIKMNLFHSSKFIDKLLLLCGRAILLCDFYDKDCKLSNIGSKDRDWEKFEERCILDEVDKGNLVRERSIKRNINLFINSCIPLKKDNLKKSSSKMWNYVSDDRRWISSYIDSMCNLNAKNVLFLDAARSMYKNNPGSNKDNLLLHLDRIMQESSC